MLEQFEGPWEINYEVDCAKHLLGINRPNSELTIDEIKRVCRQVGSLASDTVFAEDGTITYNTQGLQWMVLVCLYCFPKIYEEFQLSQPN